MQRVFFPLICFCLPLLVFSQEMVKVNILEMYSKIPAPPANVNEGYTRAECVSSTGVAQPCETKKYYKPSADSFVSLAQQLEKLSAVLAMPANASMMTMDPEAIKKKMASMSDAEKMQFAMQMTQQMGLGPKDLQPESDEVQAALDEYHQINQLIAADMQDTSAIARKGQLTIERQRQHEKINEWAQTEHKKIPLVVFGEAGRFPEPKAAYALEVKTMEKRLAVENDYLQKLQAQWQAEREQQKARFASFQQKLMLIEYGEAAVNVEYKRLLLGGQAWMLGAGQNLLDQSRDATAESARWWVQKLQLEQKKPR